MIFPQDDSLHHLWVFSYPILSISAISRKPDFHRDHRDVSTYIRPSVRFGVWICSRSLLCKARQGQSEDGTSPLPRGVAWLQPIHQSWFTDPDKLNLSIDHSELFLKLRITGGPLGFGPKSIFDGYVLDWCWMDW